VSTATRGVYRARPVIADRVHDDLEILVGVGPFLVGVCVQKRNVDALQDAELISRTVEGRAGRLRAQWQDPVKGLREYVERRVPGPVAVRAEHVPR